MATIVSITDPWEGAQGHVEQLADDLGCGLIQQSGLSGMMYVEHGYVEGPWVYCQRDYLAVLHELGHFEMGHTQGRPPHGDRRRYFDNGVLRSEAEAWEWALDRMRGDLEEGSRRFMWDVCLGSYYLGYLTAGGRPSRLGNGDRDHVVFTYDKPGRYFRRIVRRIQGDLEGFSVPWFDGDV
jgi:hypothetical protein